MLTWVLGLHMAPNCSVYHVLQRTCIDFPWQSTTSYRLDLEPWWIWRRSSLLLWLVFAIPGIKLFHLAFQLWIFWLPVLVMEPRNLATVYLCHGPYSKCSMYLCLDQLHESQIVVKKGWENLKFIELKHN